MESLLSGLEVESKRSRITNGHRQWEGAVKAGAEEEGAVWKRTMWGGGREQMQYFQQ